MLRIFSTVVENQRIQSMSTLPSAKRDKGTPPDTCFSALGADCFEHTLGYVSDISLCALSATAKVLLSAARGEQGRRDDAADAEQLQAWCERLSLGEDDYDSSNIDCRIEFPQYTDPRERTDLKWDIAPLHVQTREMGGFVDRVLKKITLELHVGDRLQEVAEGFEGMLTANGCTDHAELDGPLNADVMGRVLGCWLQHAWESGGTRTMDLADVLTGTPLECIFDTAPRDSIFEIVTDAIGYDDDERRHDAFPLPRVFTGVAGSLGKYRRTLKDHPDFVLPKFADRPPLSEAAHEERRRKNAAFVAGLFEWKW